MARKTKETSREKLSALIKRTDKENPKPADVKALRKFLDEDSKLVEANLVSNHTFLSVIKSYAPSSVLLEEVLDRQVKGMRSEMGYDDENTIVKMLIDQVIMNYIRINQLEALHISKLQARHTSQEGIYWDKRLNAAQRRFTRACESLTKVKKVLAEAELRVVQSQAKRRQGAVMATKLLKDLTSG